MSEAQAIIAAVQAGAESLRADIRETRADVREVRDDVKSLITAKADHEARIAALESGQKAGVGLWERLAGWADLFMDGAKLWHVLTFAGAVLAAIFAFTHKSIAALGAIRP